MSDIYLSLTETPSVVTLSQPVVSGALSSTVTVANTVTVALDANSLAALESVTVTVGNVTIGSSVSISNFPSTQTIAGTVTASLAPQAKGPVVEADSAIPSDPKYMAVVGGAYLSGGGTNEYRFLRTDNGGQVQVGSLPAISGTVTVGNSVTVSGTVTANGGDFAGAEAASVPSKVVLVGGENTGDSTIRALKINNDGRLACEVGTAYAYVYLADDLQPTGTVDGAKTYLDVKAIGTVTVGNSVTVAGTVTAAAPNGALTTRFGSVTTANTAEATSAVTNASRKYLLIQNVTTSSNVITVGIGFTPTTTQGIQLTAGAGITFESSYIPTGAVYVLSSVTASNFTVLEA